MAKLSPFKKHGKEVFRLVFKVCFPDGGTVFRDRLFDKKKVSQYKKQVAIEIESATSRQRYEAKDIIVWQNEGLISKDDANRLGIIHAADKTLDDAINDYIESWDISKAESKSRKSRLKNISKIWGEKTRISTLTHQDGIKLRRILWEDSELSKPTVNKHIQEIKRIFDLALANGVLQVNPMARVPALKIDEHEKFKPSALTSQDVTALLQLASDNDQRPRRKGEKILLGGFLELFLLFYFGCGMRRSEVLKLDWSMIDLNKRVIAIPGQITKTKKPRKIGIGARLLDKLLSCRKKEGPIVPQFHPDTITHQIKLFFTKNGYSSIRLHDARHTFSTIFQAAGASKEEARDRLGHADIDMTSHYTHLIDEGGNFEILEDNIPFLQPDDKAKHH
jgi:integrase